MRNVAIWLEATLGMSPATQDRVFTSIALILLLWLTRRLALMIVWRRSLDPLTRYRWQKGTAYVLTPLGILLVGRLWISGFGSLATFLGLLSAGVAIALKDALSNLAGWLFIIWRRPFDLGDRVQVGTHRGDVIDLRIFMFTLQEIGNWVHADQATGRVLHVPNGRIFTDVFANYTQGFPHIWNEIPVTVTFESDWQKAKTLLAEILGEEAAKFHGDSPPAPRALPQQFRLHEVSVDPAVVTSVADIGVTLTARYVCAPRVRRYSEQVLWERILRAFAEHRDIDFAYPTVRYYDNRLEGKAAPPA